MHGRVFAAVKMLDKLAVYVIPKRLPLVFPAPDVLALRKRYLEAHLLLEYRERGNGVSIHNSILMGA